MTSVKESSCRKGLKIDYITDTRKHTFPSFGPRTGCNAGPDCAATSAARALERLHPPWPEIEVYPIRFAEKVTVELRFRLSTMNDLYDIV